MNQDAKAKFEGKTIAFFGDFTSWPSYHGASPSEVAASYGAKVVESVDASLAVLVLGDGRGKGRAEAKKKAAKLLSKPPKGTTPKIEILDEVGFRRLVRHDTTNKSFCFAGGFDCAPDAKDTTLLANMVTSVGGVVVSDVKPGLDYLVLGNRRGKGKAEAEREAQSRIAANEPLRIVGEEAFLELVRNEVPTTGAVDFGTLVSNLYPVVDEGKLKRAFKMLQSEAFRLYARIDEEVLIGVVRSQTGVGTVYAPWLKADGRYGCTTPNLEDCMGLQGSMCKHLLVLVLGLAHAGDLEPSRALAWIRAVKKRKPASDSELAASTYIQYHGAEAGEIDWRPTETIPEDYYALG